MTLLRPPGSYPAGSYPPGSAQCLKILLGGAAALLLAMPLQGQPHPPDQGEEWLSSIMGDPGLAVDVPMKDLAARNFDSIWLTPHRKSTLGFVGSDYQRVRIRFLTVTRESVTKEGVTRERKSPPVFAVTGKTMVREVICAFKGRIEVTEAKGIRTPKDSSNRRAVLMGRYRFDEDAHCRDPGRFKGVFTSNILLVGKTGVRYDTLEREADGFWNNAFVGTWKKPGDSLASICNWGDYRIPYSGNLDEGVGEFSVAADYRRFGWERYVNAVNGDKAAINAEADRWWEWEPERESTRPKPDTSSKGKIPAKNRIAPAHKRPILPPRPPAP